MANGGFFLGGLGTGLAQGAQVGFQARELGLKQQGLEQAQQEAERKQKIEVLKMLSKALLADAPNLAEARRLGVNSQAMDATHKTAIAKLNELGLELFGVAVGDQVENSIMAQAAIPPEVPSFQSPEGQALGDVERGERFFGQGSPEVQQLVEAAARAGEEGIKTQVVNSRDAEGNQVTQLINSDTGEVIREIGAGPTIQFQPQQLPASKKQELAERSDILKQGVELVDQALSLPEGSFGATATISRGLREITRIGGELTKAGVPKEIAAPLQGLADLGEQMIDRAIQEGRLDPETAAELVRSDLTEAQVFETRLAFMVANALQPSGKLLKDSINSARDIVKLSGIFTSEKTARERLGTIRNILSRAQKGLTGSAPKEPTKPKRFRFDPETDQLVPVE